VPRDSIGRRVARAASIGGGRAYRSRTPYGWYAMLIAVCLIGLGLIAYSRHERLAAASSTTTTSTTTTTTPAEAPEPNTLAHWQVALSVDVCGHVVNLPRSATQQSGLTTTGNGVVNVEPILAGKHASEFEGANATVGKFLSAENVTLGDTFLDLPASLDKVGGRHTNGDRCGSRPGQAELAIWFTPTTTTPHIVTSGGAAFSYANGEMFMVAFVPKGTVLPRPLGQKAVAVFLKANPTGSVVPPTTTTTTTPGTTTTTKSHSTTTTTTSSGSTSTTAG
jgi:hypothetical protein